MIYHVFLCLPFLSLCLSYVCLCVCLACPCPCHVLSHLVFEPSPPPFISCRTAPMCDAEHSRFWAHSGRPVALLPSGLLCGRCQVFIPSLSCVLCLFVVFFCRCRCRCLCLCLCRRLCRLSFVFVVVVVVVVVFVFVSVFLSFCIFFFCIFVVFLLSFLSFLSL